MQCTVLMTFNKVLIHNQQIRKVSHRFIRYDDVEVWRCSSLTYHGQLFPQDETVCLPILD
jgi:hypothetical protein